MSPHVEHNILDVLQLYEYAMSIGKSLHYEENCDQFLRLILKRKNLNACWILSIENDLVKNQYAIPFGKSVRSDDKDVLHFLKNLNGVYLDAFENIKSNISPVKLDRGYICIYPLREQGFLFLYSKNNEFKRWEISKLLPVVNKFANSLRACRIFENQQKILQQLEESNQELNDYAHVVSHDLKSPIRNVETMVSWLEEEFQPHINEDRKEYFGLIRDNLGKMESLISDILSYSSIGSETQNIDNIPAKDCIESVVNHNFIPNNFTFDIPEDLPIIQGDQHRLSQLFQNLINNAVKYNDKDQGSIKISYEELTNHHQFSIEDNGIGIEAQYYDKIFNTFQKLHNFKDSSGIGLSIVKRIVQNYGGKVWVESKLGEGSIFFFTLHKNLKN